MGFSLDAAAARPLLQPYAGGEATRRYYQDAAIRAVLEKVARCELAGEPKRALLSLATGAGHRPARSRGSPDSARAGRTAAARSGAGG
jgi:hypothetical protein